MMTHLSGTQGYLGVLHLAELGQFIQDGHQLVSQGGVTPTQLVLKGISSGRSLLQMADLLMVLLMMFFLSELWVSP